MSLEAISTTERLAKACRNDAYLSSPLRSLTYALHQKIICDGGVQDAMDSFIKCFDGPDANTVPAAVRLLNGISLAYHRHVTRDGPAVGFSSGPLPHVFTGVDERPDWVAYETSIETLRADLGDTDGPLNCSTILGAGESSLSERGETALLWFLNIIKCNRPDVDTSNGLRFDNASRSVHLASLNAAGTSSSRGKPFDTLDVWIAHVVLLYDALAKRDTRFTFVGHGPHDAHWSFKTGSGIEEAICFQKVYSATALGKMTWAGYSTCQHPSGSDADGVTHGNEAIGVFKVSWQNTKHAHNEGEMLEAAHEDTWLPGLVRHWGSWREEGPGLTVTDGHYTRIKDIVHLASIGQPLSQCGSALELLEVMFDALSTVMGLNKRDILHRDLSWNNVMCQPRHDPALLERVPHKKVASVEQVPCIRYVLTGDRDAEPCALVTDLDLSAPLKANTAEKYKGPDGWVGTQMFISLERSSDTRKGRSKVSTSNLDALQSQLFKVEKHPELFKRAFPDDNGRFHKFIERVFNAEAKRTDTQPYTPRDIGHHPRHDVESLYWVLSWSLGRALPKGCDPLDDREGNMSRFVDAMLDSANESSRCRYFEESNIEGILHPKLRRFAPMLKNMVRYLSVPWDRHHRSRPNCNIELYHAHIAFMRLLLEEIRILYEHPELNVVFDTSQPRIRNLPKDDVVLDPDRTPPATDETASATPSATADGTSTGATSVTVTPENETAREAQTTVLKRKRGADDVGVEDDRSPKRSKTKYLPRLTVGVLAEMFNTDRKLWGSGGRRVSGPKGRSPAAEGFIFVPRSGAAQHREGLLDSGSMEEPIAKPHRARQPYSEEA